MRIYFHSMRTRSLIATLLCAVVFTLPLAVSAQSQIQMKVSPAVIQEKTDPGQTIVRSITVSNLSAEDQTLFPDVIDIVGQDEKGIPRFARPEDSPKGFTLQSWVAFQQKSYVVGAGRTVTIPFTIRVPNDASPGTHSAWVYVASAPGNERPNATGVGFQIGTPVILQVSGEVNIAAMITEFSTSKVVYQEPKISFVTRVENTGNVFVQPRGVISIDGTFESKIEPLLVNEAGAGILPKSTRSFQTDWSPQGFHLGHYTANVALTYGAANAQKNLTASIDFWILPIGRLLPIFGGLLLVVVVFYVLLRMYIRSQIVRHGGSRAALVQRERARGVSRLAAVVIALLVAVIIGLLVLFIYFG